jgi:hypothetical protein
MPIRKKRSISMPPDVDAEIAAAAQQAGLSYSLAAVAEFEREHGAFGAAELAEATAWADRAVERADRAADRRTA